jgi:hypothetical protein
VLGQSFVFQYPSLTLLIKYNFWIKKYADSQFPTGPGGTLLETESSASESSVSSLNIL